ncbi:MAG: hypothetical protein KDC95_09290 [Planctomycetes bacterium]|nr:hypothetical protein [Planctomycetota bacterium]
MHFPTADQLVKLAFQTRELRDACLRESAALEVYGEELGRRVLRRVADLDAAQTMLDLPVGNPRLADGTEGRYRIDIGDSHFMEISANHVKNPLGAAGETDWSRVDRIKIEGIYES